MKRLLLVVMSAAAVMSCTHSEIQGPQSGVQLSFTVTQRPFQASDVATRAIENEGGETVFQNGDEIGVYVHSTSQVSGQGNHSSNMRYLTSDKGGSWVAANALGGEFKSGVSYYSTAYWPYCQGVSNPTSVTHSVGLDQSSKASTTETGPGAFELSDFMVASGAAITGVPSAPKSTLVFSHYMTKLVISLGVPTLIDGGTVTGVTSVVIKNMKTSCVVDLSKDAAGGVTASGGTDNIIIPRLSSAVVAAGKVAQWEAMVVPQSIESGVDLVEIVCQSSKGSKTLKYTVPAGSPLSFRGGNRVTLALSSSADLAFTGELNLLDGVAKTGQPLSVKVPAGVAWTLSSPAAWLTVSATAGGSYSAKITGTGSGDNQTIYVGVGANGSATVGREAVLTLSTVSGSATYLAVQNYYSFGVVGSWSPTAGQGTVAIAPFTANQVWGAQITTGAEWLQFAKSAVYGQGGPTSSVTGQVGSLVANNLYYQAATNNTAGARSATVVYTPATAGVAAVSTTITQAAPAVGVSATGQSVVPHATSATFNVTGTGQQGVVYTPTAGSNATSVSPNSAQTISGSTHTGAVTVGFTANGGAQRSVVATIRYGVSLSVTHTITQAAAALSLSAYTAVVGAQVTSSAFTLTSNVPYGSGYTSGGSSAQGVGNTPPYNALPVTFSFPAQGAAPAASRTHTMTITPSPNNSASSQVRTFVVTQASVGPELTISSSAPGVIVPKAGATYYTNIASNTTWSAVGTNATVTASGSGNVNSFAITIPATTQSTTRTVSVAFTTTTNAGQTAVTRTWSGTQEIGVIPITWATGNLVANGANDCKIGASTDCGLYFRFGSLVGWSGGANGNGVGTGSPALGISVKPVGYTGSSDWGSAGYYKDGAAESLIPLVGNAATGIGDPCRYYLGGKWRTPTKEEYAALCNNKSGTDKSFPWSEVGGSWQASPAGGNLKGLFLPAAGYRGSSDGSIAGVGSYGYYWSATVPNASLGYSLYFYSTNVLPQSTNNRTSGRPVRCVSE